MMDHDAACETSNNNIDAFTGGSNNKRLRLDGNGEEGSPCPNSSPPPFREKQENNNKESLLSQALEKPAMINFIGNNGGRSDGHDDSGASDTGSERPESMLDGSFKADSNMSSGMDLHRSLSSPATAAAAAAAGLFPPGLEALYRQAGFPTAFLGLGGGGSGSGGASSGVHHVSNSGPTAPYSGHIGLQSHANNPTSKKHKILEIE
jgi:hypothetical protein